MTQQKIRVLLVDHQKLVRGALRAALSSYADIEVIGETIPGDERKMPDGNLDVHQVVMNYDLPNGNRDRKIQRLALLYPDARITLLTGMSAAFINTGHFPRGIFAVVHKEISFEALPETLRSAARKPAPTSPYLIALPSRTAATDLKPLSRREFQVLNATVSGTTPADTARELGVNAKTVYSYRRRLMGKLGLSGIPELVRFAIANGLVE